MSLHWSRAPISLGKDNHFLFCLLSWEMEEGAAEVGESQMDITLTFEEWKANKRVTGEEGKLNLPFQRLFSLHICHGFHVHCPNYRRLVNSEVKSRLSNDIFPHVKAHASHKETTELWVRARPEGRRESEVGGIVLLLIPQVALILKTLPSRRSRSNEPLPPLLVALSHMSE